MLGFVPKAQPTEYVSFLFEITITHGEKESPSRHKLWSLD
jgi:hypothetical protein